MRALALAALMAAGSAVADDGETITVPRTRVEQCMAQGGCHMVTHSELIAAMQKAYDLWVAETLATLDSQGCRRGNT